MLISDRAKLIACLNPEQRLLIAVCSDQSSPLREKAKKWFARPFSWESLVALSERHKLFPIFYKNLHEDSTKYYIDIPSSLKEKFAIQKQQVLRLAVEGVRISSVLSQEKISSILLKGPFLSEQIYDDISLRPSRDIDILVQPENILQVKEILQNEGYKMIYPDFQLTRRQTLYYESKRNQYAFRNPENGCMVELHWRLFSQKSLFPVYPEDVFLESQEMMIAGKPIRVLSSNHSVEFLCIHGALHQWFRLLWLRDIAQIFDKKGFDYDDVLKCAKPRGNERTIEQAARLSHLFFGTQIGKSFESSSKPTKAIVNHAIGAIVSDERLTLSHKLIRLRMPIYKMKLKRGFTHKLSCWSIFQPNFNDWKKMKLPDWLFFLYFILRPFIWFKTYYFQKGK